MNKNFYKIIIAFAVLAITTLSANAQVTIGFDGAPEKAMLLELKNKIADNNNVTVVDGKPGGLGLPRVRLVSKTSLEPFIAGANPTTTDKKVHTGMMVYNLQDNTNFKPGIYVWDGNQWVSQKSSDDAWLLNGNAGATSKFLGTTDSNPVTFKTNNTQRMNIAANGDISIGNKDEAMTSTYMNLPTTSSTSVLNLVSGSDGKIYKQDLGNSVKPINYIVYQLKCTGNSGDWIKDFNTTISATNYTMVVVGATFTTNTGGEIGLVVGTTTGGTYNPYSVYADNVNNEWHLHADYIGGQPVGTTKGMWRLYCLIIHNSLVKTFSTITQEVPQEANATTRPAGL
jgi:hypothetical protein